LLEFKAISGILNRYFFEKDTLLEGLDFEMESQEVIS
jgi:hypothetical protein